MATNKPKSELAQELIMAIDQITTLAGDGHPPKDTSDYNGKMARLGGKVNALAFSCGLANEADPPYKSGMLCWSTSRFVKYAAVALDGIEKLFPGIGRLYTLRAKAELLVENGNEDKQTKKQKKTGQTQQAQTPSEIDLIEQIVARLKQWAQKHPHTKRIKPLDFHDVCYSLRVELESTTDGLNETLFYLRENGQTGKAEAIEKLYGQLLHSVSVESHSRSDGLAPMYLELDSTKKLAALLARELQNIMPAGTEQDNKTGGPPQSKYIFRKEGPKNWLVKFESVNCILGNQLGVRYVAELLARKNKEISTMELYQTVNPPPAKAPKSPESPEPVMDKEYLQDCTKKLEELRIDLEKARKDNNLAEQDRLQQEINQIQETLSKGLGLGGRLREFSNKKASTRVSVTTAINNMIKSIKKDYPKLHQHLKNSVHTGETCSYKPDRDIDWQL